MPFITKEHNLKLNMLLHSEAQDGKLLVDGHFSVAIMHDCRFVDQGNSVKTPPQLANPINSYGVISNAVSDLVHINREYSRLTMWESSKHVAMLPRLNEVQYEQISEEGNKLLKYKADVYRMSGLSSIPYELGQYSSKRKVCNGSGNVSVDDNSMYETVDGADAEAFSNNILEVDPDCDEEITADCDDFDADDYGSKFPFNGISVDYLEETVSASRSTWFTGIAMVVSIRTDAHVRFLTHQLAQRSI